MKLSRRDAFKLAGAGAIAAAAPRVSFLPELQARSLPVKIGITDWNLNLEAKLEAVALAKRLGFDGVQVSCGKGTERLPLSDAALQEKYLQEAAAQQIPICATCLEVLHRDHLKDNPIARRWVADSVPIARALKTDVVLLPFFGPAALKTTEERAHVADLLKEIAPDAEKAGVILGLENTNSARENVEIMDRVKSPAVQVYYDIGNSTNGHYDIIEEIGFLGKERICQIHIKDNPHLLGQGKIDMRRVADAIAGIGYSRWCVLETSSPRKNLDLDLSYDLGVLRGLFLEKA